MYKYKLPAAYQLEHPTFKHVVFSNEFLTIGGGVLSIEAGYCWDGCSPKTNILGLFEIGTPDGIQRHGLPWLYYPSLVHDVLCQFRHRLPFSKDQATGIFSDLMNDTKWPLATLYTSAVHKFGPQDFIK
jgi:hypothetical protein